MRNVLLATLAAAAGLAGTGASSDIEKGNMLLAFVDVLDAMVYAAAGLSLFAVVWAGFLLMAEGAEDRGSGKARASVALAVTGLALTLSAKGIALVLVSIVNPTT